VGVGVCLRTGLKTGAPGRRVGFGVAVGSGVAVGVAVGVGEGVGVGVGVGVGSGVGEGDGVGSGDRRHTGIDEVAGSSPVNENVATYGAASGFPFFVAGAYVDDAAVSSAAAAIARSVTDTIVACWGVPSAATVTRTWATPVWPIARLDVPRVSRRGGTSGTGAGVARGDVDGLGVARGVSDGGGVRRGVAVGLGVAARGAGEAARGWGVGGGAAPARSRGSARLKASAMRRNSS
jgi:hypothetical protein